MTAVGRRRRGPELLVTLAVAVTIAACAGPWSPGHDQVAPARSGSVAGSGDAVAPRSGGTAPPGASGVGPDARSAIPAAPRAGAAPASPRSITIAATGEILVHPSVWRDADTGSGMDFGPVLAGVAPLLAGVDLAVCHLETPLAAAGGPYSGYPAFATPPAIVTAIAATGFDTCSNASNHSLDQGFAGVVRTLDGLDAVGVGHAGLARSAAEASAPTIRDVHGVRVAHLAYTRDLNGNAPPHGREWAVARLSIPRVLADARRAKEAGAQIVVVTLHHGTEYQTEPDAAQRSVVEALAASPDIDLVLGHHAHVVQPVVRIGTTWVAFGLGNLVSGQSAADPRRREGVVVRWRFVQRPDGRFVADRVEAFPTYNTASPSRVVDVVAALRSGSDSSALRAAYDRVRSTVLAEGASTRGMVVPSP